MIISCEIMFSVSECSKTIEMKMFVVKWDDLTEQDHTYRMPESEYFHCRQNWWVSLNKSGNTTEPLRKRSVLNQALSALNRLHREAGGDQLEPILYLKHKQRRRASRSSFTWWRKSRQAEVLGLNVETRCLQYFGENLRRCHSRFQFILLHIDRLQLPQMTRFPMCNKQ